MADESQHVLLHKLTRREFRERMQSGALRACIIPVGATEQHLEHLAMEHDWRACLHIAIEAAKRLHPQVLVVPVMNVGISEHHMAHPGTLTATPGSWLGLLLDAIASMKEAGFEHILVLNGHGGNVEICKAAWPQFLRRLRINLHFRSYWDFLPPEVAQANLKTGRWPGHAQEFETAFALALFPENVRQDALHDQADRQALSASAEAGTAMVQAVIDGVTAFVAGMISGDRVAEIPPFHP